MITFSPTSWAIFPGITAAKTEWNLLFLYVAVRHYKLTSEQDMNAWVVTCACRITCKCSTLRGTSYVKRYLSHCLFQKIVLNYVHITKSREIRFISDKFMQHNRGYLNLEGLTISQSCHFVSVLVLNTVVKLVCAMVQSFRSLIG
jgi:hypothetical protein